MSNSGDFPVHEGRKMIDQRHVINCDERAGSKQRKSYFAQSLPSRNVKKFIHGEQSSSAMATIPVCEDSVYPEYVQPRNSSEIWSHAIRQSTVTDAQVTVQWIKPIYNRRTIRFRRLKDDLKLQCELATFDIDRNFGSRCPLGNTRLQILNTIDRNVPDLLNDVSRLKSIICGHTLR